jgi:hypothetical protein
VYLVPQEGADQITAGFALRDGKQFRLDSAWLRDDDDSDVVKVQTQELADFLAAHIGGYQIPDQTWGKT